MGLFSDVQGMIKDIKNNYLVVIQDLRNSLVINYIFTNLKTINNLSSIDFQVEISFLVGSPNDILELGSVYNFYGLSCKDFKLEFGVLGSFDVNIITCTHKKRKEFFLKTCFVFRYCLLQ